MKNKKLWIIIGAVIVLVLVIGLSIFFFKKGNDKPENSDAISFSEEYTEVGENNVFVYRTVDEILNILEHGTGIVYLGFPECPWCQRYTKYLNEVAIDTGLEKIYYYNIREDRSDNTENYQKMVSILEEYLQYDDEGNKRIYAPSIIALEDGEIVGFDDETAWDTKGFSTPDEYWDDESVESLKNRLEEMIYLTGSNICTECN